ncbi:DNA mismatch repair protein Msh2 isoform X1 [Pectinophora gossypiella]|uniref:DNA mismatch repair protein Msh2 isoform X1 n=2 Tax=Pectinophora gossypiella TaxID=13191 RepID=UPI00214EE3EC|nr:DNA mismatch repair protein Msh2 isoform X1 [Pectinophora gossypiella]XP_049872413.1 DNA mismatch repair protein Msh2 isoform X1 [Pectinophora gossypiella]
MSSLQPIHALNLDSEQQQAFIAFFNSLPEKPPTTVRIFDRNDYYSVHGVDATTSAREVFSSISNIKKMGLKPNLLDYLVLSKGNFEILIRKLLLVRRYRVEIYVKDGPGRNSEWVLKYKGSPGCLTQLEEVLSEGLGATDEQTPCLMSVHIKTDSVTKGRLLGVACVTAGDYQMSVAEFTDDDLLTELETITVQMAPSECLVPSSDNEDYKALKKVMERAAVTVTKLKNSDFSTEGLMQDLNRLLKFKEDQQQDANAFPETRKNVAMSSLAAAISYAGLLTENTNFGRFRLSTIQADCFLHLDAAALSALNVLPELGDNSHAPARSLLGLLDRCRTQQGKRLLAQWLRQPLRDINLINERLDVVELLVNNSQLRLQLHEDHLRRIPDLQALARRLTRKKANLHDCYKIYQAINRLPALLQCLAEAKHPTVHSSLEEPIAELNEDLNKYLQMIEATVDMDAVERGDFLVKPSFDEQLQNLSEQLDSLQNSADKELNRAARDLGLDAGKTIKLDSNPQNGFYFRVTMKEEQSLRGNKKYTIIDAVKGGVRFKTNALENITDEYLQTKASYEKEQDKVVAEIVGIAAGYSECLFCLSHILSRLDVLVSFAVAASTAPYPYCRPVITEELDEFVLKEVRHPCLEVQEGISYIPNDVEFKRGSCLLHVVTGANMGGKSTWMRSCGVAALLAHAGCMVPATTAIVPRLRALCARVGASDREDKGQSTFMLEMVETAAILKTATPDSLVLVDELGRGTSTYEGCGIAWAVAEELATNSKCFCLFATHYHELTRLESLHPGVIVNSHAEATVVDQQLLLLHKIVPGPATHSLGLHVAKLADLPDSIIEYAEAKQAQLETNLFEAETAVKSQETKEGQTIILDFLKKCKEIQESTASDEDMMKQINSLKQNVLRQNNKYVQSLLA